MLNKNIFMFQMFYLYSIKYPRMSILGFAVILKNIEIIKLLLSHPNIDVNAKIIRDGIS